MPKTSFDALEQEIGSFREALEAVKKKVLQSQDPVKSRAAFADKLDDLENIVITFSAMNPQIAPKIKAAFEHLRDTVEFLPGANPENALQLCNRLDSQAESISRRVYNMLHTEDSEANASQAGGIIRAQEEERRRISREIHDGPAQTLASLTMRIDYCIEQHARDEVLVNELLELKDSVIKSLKDIRRFIFDLRPMALDDLGLIPTIEQFISGFKSRTGISVHVEVEGERIRLSADRELAVFRVVQEAANNAVKHAEPSSIHIFLNYDSGRKRLSVVVKDDGKGFDIAEIRGKYGSLKKLGLISMEERVKFAGGDFQIVSDIGTGTVVSFWVPI